MIKHTKAFTFCFMEFITSIFRDLKSFRNKVTVFVCVLCTLCLYYHRGNTTVVLSVLGFLDSYLIYYLHNRKRSDDNKKEGI